MRVALLEVCRRPEIPKTSTEAIVLSRVFKDIGIDFDLYSNDRYWYRRKSAGKVVSMELIATLAANPLIDVLHFAMHGNESGLILSWSGPLDERDPETILGPRNITEGPRLGGKLIVSGACQSAHLADEFIAAGARAVIAPSIDVPWMNLGAFFKCFYAHLFSGLEAAKCLELAKLPFAELASYRLITAAARLHQANGHRRPERH